MSVKYTINTCLLIVDASEISILLTKTSSEELSDPVNEDERAEAILELTCACKTTSGCEDRHKRCVK